MTDVTVLPPNFMAELEEDFSEVYFYGLLIIIQNNVMSVSLCTDYWMLTD